MRRLALGCSGGGSNYNLVPLPELESQANGDVFVCEFNGGTAQNEVGVGGGLSGADLVLTQGGSTPGTSGGYRPLVANSSQGFSPTDNFFNTFFRNSSGFSACWKLRNACRVNAVGANFYIMRFYSTLINFYLSVSYSTQLLIGEMVVNEQAVRPAIDRKTFTGVTSDVPVFITVSFDRTAGVGFSGVSYGSQPKTLDEYSSYSVYPASGAIPSAQTYPERSLVGRPGHGNNADLSVGCIAWAKYPVFTMK